MIPISRQYKKQIITVTLRGDGWFWWAIDTTGEFDDSSKSIDNRSFTETEAFEAAKKYIDHHLKS